MEQYHGHRAVILVTWPRLGTRRFIRSFSQSERRWTQSAVIWSRFMWHKQFGYQNNATKDRHHTTKRTHARTYKHTYIHRHAFCINNNNMSKTKIEWDNRSWSKTRFSDASRIRICQMIKDFVAISFKALLEMRPARSTCLTVGKQNTATTQRVERERRRNRERALAYFHFLYPLRPTGCRPVFYLYLSWLWK